ncbi:xylose isomerase [Clostridiales bacterium COT073_COT-073]|nr:xylose isomerase [Clostridiales bacterium COT073_COT-073]
MQKFETLTHIPYAPETKEPFSFRWYNPDEVLAGKKMRDHLKFAMAYWHTIGAEGVDMFGAGTLDKTFGQKEPMDIYRAKADCFFRMMDILNIDYYCFHDVDIAPEGSTVKESLANFNEMVNYVYELQKKYNKKCLWVTANNFSDKKFMAGAATSCCADVFTVAAAKVRACIDAAIKLGATGYVFWGGREGYDTLLNTDMGLELDNMARFLTMARDYGRKNGFKGDFYIEPKPKEPTKHQYDFDVATCMNFLRKYNLTADFKMNIEANHATLATHTFEHELRTAIVNDSFGSIDANQGDLLLGWDTDQFPTDVYSTTYCMLEVLRAGGFTNGGLNFDAKTRRQSNTFEDIILAHISGMDAFALGLRKALEIMADGRIEAFVKERYSSYNSGIGQKIVEGNITLEELADYACTLGEIEVPSGRQEYLETVVNRILFR